MKTCIFCGQYPEAKTKEHVIPRWLINLTGDSKRFATFGYDLESKKAREFSFDRFQFPACDQCNEKFSAMEEKSKQIMLHLINNQPLNNESFSHLLTWFDKVRIGLWLGFLKLNKNKFGIEPNFHIQSGINRADRLLFIYRTSDIKDGINFFCVGTPSFDFAPVAFGFRINNYFFINASATFLFSRRLGLPFSAENYISDTHRGAVGIIQGGLERIITPLIRGFRNIAGTEIYQPVAMRAMVHDKKYRTYYDNAYCKNFFALEESMLGKILINDSGNIIHYMDIASDIWVPTVTLHKSDVYKHVAKGAIWFQNYFNNEMVNGDYLSGKYKRNYKKLMLIAKIVNRRLIEKLESD